MRSFTVKAINRTDLNIVFPTSISQHHTVATSKQLTSCLTTRASPKRTFINGEHNQTATDHSAVVRLQTDKWTTIQQLSPATRFKMPFNHVYQLPSQTTALAHVAVLLHNSHVSRTCRITVLLLNTLTLWSIYSR